MKNKEELRDEFLKALTVVRENNNELDRIMDCSKLLDVYDRHMSVLQSDTDTIKVGDYGTK